MNADAGLGGLPAQRPDQQRNYPPTGVQPGSSSGIVRARLVIVSGTGVSGVFVYDGTPGLGNPPIVSITNGDVDPYGNTVIPGLDVTQGVISGTTISASTFEGSDFVIDSSGAFFYNGTPGAGNPPVLNIVPPGVTTDPFGNTVIPVLTVGNATAAHLEVDQSGIMYLTNASNSITLLADPALTLIEWIPGGLGTDPAVTIAAVTGTDPGFFPFPAGIQTNLPTYLVDVASVPGSEAGTAILVPASGQLVYLAGDGNSYDTGHLLLLTPNPASQTVSSTSPVAVNGNGASGHLAFTIPVGGTYHVHGRIPIICNQAGGIPTFTLTWPAQTSNTNVRQMWFVATGAATSPLVTFSRGASPASFAGPTMVNGDNFDYEFDFVGTFSGGGTFLVEASTSVAADTFTIQALGYIDVQPIVAS
jgi:hypothetical protein